MFKLILLNLIIFSNYLPSNGCLTSSSSFIQIVPPFQLSDTTKTQNISSIYSDCGMQTVSPTIGDSLLNKIINGDSAKPNSWPWAVSLRYQTGEDSYSHVCGGSLISYQLVVTAAHCFDGLDFRNFVIVIGNNYLNDTLNSGNMFTISSLHIHENYDPVRIKNDIALIKLSKQVTISSKVMPICIPNSYDVSLIYNKYVVVTGWGSINGAKNQTILSNNLLQTTLQIRNYYSLTMCNGFDSSNYCAIDTSGKNSNICFGDSGGGLYYQSNGKWYLYGISSFVIASDGACVNTQPSFYTIIPNYLYWIISH